MGFKLGSERGNYAINGEIKTKMNFGKNSGGDGSVPGTPVISKKLGGGIMGEANNDGTIFISNEIPEGSPLEKKVIKHEAKHMVDMKTGKLGYNDDHIKWNGKKYARKDGKINYKGKWIPEGSKDFPWEKH